MRLEEWLKIKNMTAGALAQMIGVSRSQVHKYVHDGAFPRKKETVLGIFKVTKGAVTPNDLFGLTLELCNPEKCKRIKMYEDYKNVRD